MSDYENILKEDKAWWENFQTIKVPDMVCDVCRTNKATRWYGNTNVVLCNEAKCYQEQEQRYRDWVPECRDYDDD